MSVPNYEIEVTKGTSYTFRVQVVTNGSPTDVTGWGQMWFAAKRSPLQVDADAVYTKVRFDGVEPVSGEPSKIEITINDTDGASLEEGIKHTLVGDVGGIDENFKPHQLLTLDITVNPRIRRSND